MWFKNEWEDMKEKLSKCRIYTYDYKYELLHEMQLNFFIDQSSLLQ